MCLSNVVDPCVSPEAHSWNFASRIKIPIWVLPGRDDVIGPLATIVIPLSALIGTLEKDRFCRIFKAVMLSSLSRRFWRICARGWTAATIPSRGGRSGDKDVIVVVWETLAKMNYLLSLSRTQWVWFIGTLAIVIAIAAVGWIMESAEGGIPDFSFTNTMSIQEIAPELEVTNKALARELGLPLEAPKGKPLVELGVTQERLDRATLHLASHRPSRLRYYIFVAVVFWGLVFLMRLGRPDGPPSARQRIGYPRTPYIVSLLVTGLACGFWLGKSPNPMEGIVKVFKSMVGLYPSVAHQVVILAFFLALAVVGNKLVCGWACPFGALQELIYSLPVLNRVKRKKIPFWLSNGIRTILFAVSLLLLFGIVGGREGFVVYHFVNPFNLFDLDFGYASITIAILGALALSFPTYRPFCQFVCPFGLISWLFERISLSRVRVDAARCIQCGACVEACPLEAAKGRVAGKFFTADCYSCARCLNVCQQDAITYGWSLRRRPGEGAPPSP